MAEIQDRSTRSSNILFHNIEESSSRNFKERIEQDTLKCKQIFDALDINVGPFKVWRLGQASNRSRPLKVTLSNNSNALFCIKNKRKLSENFPNIRIAADLTLSQRNYMKSIYEQLNERKRNGENDLVVKYRYGIPHIAEFRSTPAKNGD
ncbi:hypothetical protein JTB14_034737 [Gonioctena quinquepunctata]|nr:hypothetical protein JTB14_034737 [Gonioctena quinquepunctata]